MQDGVFCHVAFLLLNLASVAAQQSRDSLAEAFVGERVSVQMQEITPTASKTDSIFRREKPKYSDGASVSVKFAPSLPASDRRNRKSKVAHHVHRKISGKRSHHIHASEQSPAWRRSDARQSRRGMASGEARDKMNDDEAQSPVADTDSDLGYIYPDGDRRRRTRNQVWDCDFQANWVTGYSIAPTFTKYFNETDAIKDVENECKELCADMVQTCTGLYIFEEGNVPGEGKISCGFFTVDLTFGTKYVKHGTADGHFCLHVGKNFHCSDNANMVKTDTVRDDFTLEKVPSDGIVQTYAEALSWCKRKCISRDVNCHSFWLQEWRSSSWMCGMYGADVTKDDRVMSDNANVTKGCMCDSF